MNFDFYIAYYGAILNERTHAIVNQQIKSLCNNSEVTCSFSYDKFFVTF